jgi:hypothetical protein
MAEAVVNKAGFMLQTMWLFIVALVELVNSLITIEGEGSPEGVTVAPQGSDYMDTLNYLRYYKKTGSGATGWIQA